VVAFPGLIVVAAAIDRPWLAHQTKDGEFGTPMSPPFLSALEQHLHLSTGNLDALLLADPLPGPPPIELTLLTASPLAAPPPGTPTLNPPLLTQPPLGPSHPNPSQVGGVSVESLPLGDVPDEQVPLGGTLADGDAHPRVARALLYRSDVRVWASEHGLLILGRGLAGRWEIAVEVDETARNNGHGRALATAARHLVPDGRPVWGQIAPGNASSLRAFLAAGYTPVGSEVILTPFPPEAPIRHP
jgi:hypothetical protein